MLLVACAALVVLTIVCVLNPLFKESRNELDVELLAETESDHLLNRKATIYGNLKDLEFEYAMGRLSEQDFQRLEAAYKNEAAVVLRKLELSGASDDFDEAIEKEVALRKSRLLASESKKAVDGSKCPFCGAEVIAGKKYCADCGHLLPANL